MHLKLTAALQNFVELRLVQQLWVFGLHRLLQQDSSTVTSGKAGNC